MTGKKERFVHWRNDTPRMVEPTIEGVHVRLWMVGVTKSCPEKWTDQLQKLGMTKLGYAR